jgi:NADH-quinone oxidoreductase subunit F
MPEVPENSQMIFFYRNQPGSATLRVALENRAYEGLKKALTMTPEQVTQEVVKSNLRGRGGAGFPTGKKWLFMPPKVEPGRPHFLVANADESEPGTFKDHEIMVRVPHKFIEGCLVTCYAIHSNQAYIYIRGEYSSAYESLVNAINEARSSGYLGKNILGSGFDCEVSLYRGAGAYIRGEETALLDSLEGKRGYPRQRPPYAVTCGLFCKPTVVNNVETISVVPYILDNGAGAYLKHGTPKCPGTKIFSVSGHVNKPGNYECEFGITLSDLIETAGGILNGGKFKACFPGGSSSPMLGAEYLDLPLDFDSVQAAGSMLGSAGIMVMDESTDLVKIMRRVTRFYEHESCGKCTPCHQGTWWMSRIFERILSGGGTPEDVDNLYDIACNIEGNTFCLLGDAAAMPVKSLIERFRHEFDKYINQKETVSVL